jgi:hypothetical protein
MSSSSSTYSSGDAQLDVPTSISSSHHPASTVDPHQLTTQPEGQQSQSQAVTWVCGGVAQAGKELTLYLGASNGFRGDATYSAVPQQHDRPQLPPVPLQELGYLPALPSVSITDSIPHVSYCPFFRQYGTVQISYTDSIPPRVKTGVIIGCIPPVILYIVPLLHLYYSIIGNGPFSYSMYRVVSGTVTV